MRLQTVKQMTLFHIRNLLRNKIAFFFSLVLPVIFIALFGSVYGGSDGPGKTPVGLVDNDGGIVASTIRTALEQSGIYNVKLGSEADLKASMAKGGLTVIVVLPEGLSDRIAAGDSAIPVTVIRDPSSTASGQIAGVVDAFFSRIGARLTGASPVIQPVMTDLPGLERFNTFDFLMPGQMVYMLLSAGLMAVAIELANQRANGSLRHMFSTPVSVGAWTIGRMIAIALLSFAQIIVLFASAWLMFRIHMPQNIGATAVVLVLSAIATLGFGLTLGALARSGEGVYPIAMILFMGLALLGNAMMPLDVAPQFMRTIGKVMPSTFMTHALKATMMQGKGLDAIGTDLLVLIACAVVFNGIAIWRMRRQMVAA